MLNDIPQHIHTYILELSTYRIELRKDHDFVKLRFSVDLLKETPQQFWENVTMPLCSSSMELVRRYEILLDLVKRKDEEITEYKAEGAELIRSMYFFYIIFLRLLFFQTIENSKLNLIKLSIIIYISYRIYCYKTIQGRIVSH